MLRSLRCHSKFCRGRNLSCLVDGKIASWPKAAGGQEVRWPDCRTFPQPAHGPLRGSSASLHVEIRRWQASRVSIQGSEKRCGSLRPWLINFWRTTGFFFSSRKNWRASGLAPIPRSRGCRFFPFACGKGMRLSVLEDPFMSWLEWLLKLVLEVGASGTFGAVKWRRKSRGMGLPNKGARIQAQGLQVLLCPRFASGSQVF